MEEEMINQQSCDFYKDSWGHYGIHEDYLKNKPRTLTYRRAIFENPSLFQDKVVLDAGCGTGLFAMWCVQAGARVVYAVDKSSIIEYAKKIIELNGFQDRIITYHASLEEVELPEKVDVIISDWMGSCLTFDSMLPSIITARDRFLKPDGVMFPSTARMVIDGIQDAEYRAKKIGFWDDVYGFKYNAIKKWALVEPLIDTCPTSGIITDECQMSFFDMKTAKLQDFTFTDRFTLISSEKDTVHAFVVWFDVFFVGTEKTLALSTSPYHQSTVYSQTIFYLNSPISVVPNTVIDGQFSMKPDEADHRNQHIQIEFACEGRKYSQQYFLKV